MKNLLYLIAVLLLFTSINTNAQSLPQTAKGKIFLGLEGALSIGGGNQKSVLDGESERIFKSFQFQVSPRVGIFIIDNLVVGLDLEYSNSTTTTEAFNSFEEPPSEVKFKINSYAVNNFWRYYFKAGTVSPFIESFAGIGSLKLTSELSDSESTSSIVQFGGSVGMAVPLGDKVTFDSMLTFTNFSEKERENNPQDIRTVNQSFFFSTGFTVYLD